MKTPYRELEQRQKACSHHADFRGNQVAEAVKPLHVSLQAACFLPFTVATLERTSSEQMSWRKKGEASRSRQTWAFTLSLEIRKAAQRATGWAATGRGGGLETYSAAVLTGPFSPGKRSCSGRALPSEAPFKNKRGLLAAFQNNPDSSVNTDWHPPSKETLGVQRAGMFSLKTKLRTEVWNVA